MDKKRNERLYEPIKAVPIKDDSVKPLSAEEIEKRRAFIEEFFKRFDEQKAKKADNFKY